MYDPSPFSKFKTQLRNRNVYQFRIKNYSIIARGSCLRNLALIWVRGGGEEERERNWS